MADIVQLKNENGTPIYPVTTGEAINMSGGKTLDQVFAEKMEALEQDYQDNKDALELDYQNKKDALDVDFQNTKKNLSDEVSALLATFEESGQKTWKANNTGHFEFFEIKTVYWGKFIFASVRYVGNDSIGSSNIVNPYHTIEIPSTILSGNVTFLSSTAFLSGSNRFVECGIRKKESGNSMEFYCGNSTAGNIYISDLTGYIS